MISRRRKSSERRLPEVSLTPLIDTTLVLLVIFMVTTPIMQNSLSIDLPEGKMKEDSDPSSVSLVVTITGEEKLRLNTVPYSLERLLPELEKQVNAISDKRVYIECDRKVSSGTLVKIVDSIKYVAGVKRVVLSTERIR